MEVDFLRSLHAVRRMAADMERLAADLAPGGGLAGGVLLGAASAGQYAPVSAQIQQLVEATGELSSAQAASQEVSYRCPIAPR